MDSSTYIFLTLNSSDKTSGSSGNYKIICNNKAKLSEYSKVRVTNVTIENVEDLYLEVNGLGIKEVLDFSNRLPYQFKLEYDGTRYTSDSFNGIRHIPLPENTICVCLRNNNIDIVNPVNDWSFTLEFS